MKPEQKIKRAIIQKVRRTGIWFSFATHCHDLVIMYTKSYQIQIKDTAWTQNLNRKGINGDTSKSKDDRVKVHSRDTLS